jgi:hypothetical protein
VTCSLVRPICRFVNSAMASSSRARHPGTRLITAQHTKPRQTEVLPCVPVG